MRAGCPPTSASPFSRPDQPRAPGSRASRRARSGTLGARPRRPAPRRPPASASPRCRSASPATARGMRSNAPVGTRACRRRAGTPKRATSSATMAARERQRERIAAVPGHAGREASPVERPARIAGRARATSQRDRRRGPPSPHSGGRPRRDRSSPWRRALPVVVARPAPPSGPCTVEVRVAVAARSSRSNVTPSASPRRSTGGSAVQWNCGLLCRGVRQRRAARPRGRPCARARHAHQRVAGVRRAPPRSSV